MKKETEETIISKALILNSINKSKYELIMKMYELEKHGKSHSKEYVELISFYETASFIHNRRLESFSEEEKKASINIIRNLNQDKLLKTNLASVLTVEPKEIIIWKTLVDLGIKKTVYIENEDEENFLSALGIKKKKIIDKETLNSFMLSDIYNSLYTTIENEYNNINTVLNPNELLKWKYNLIFISPEIEMRALMTRFLIPNRPKLVDVECIEKVGLTEEEYIEKLDESVYDILGNILYKMLNDINRSKDHKAENIDTLYFYSLIELLTDKQLCENFAISLEKITESMDENLINQIASINCSLISAKYVQTKTLKREKTI